MLACPQRLLELLFVQPHLPGQPGQYVDLADVLPLHEERFEDSVVVLVALAVILGVLVALWPSLPSNMSEPGAFI